MKKQIISTAFINPSYYAGKIWYDNTARRAGRVADAVEISADKPTAIP